jgi:hypothetical protein
MTDPTLSIDEKAMLLLMGAGLSKNPFTDNDKFPELSEQQWKDLYFTTADKGIFAVAYDGICKLKDSKKPPLNVRINWELNVHSEEQRYAEHCKFISQLNSFCLQNKIKAVLLKGIGLAPLYPTPAHRKIGDIDIYTQSADTSALTDQEANRLIETLLFNIGATYNDEAAITPDSREIGFILNNILIENHHSFINAGENKFSRIVEQQLQSLNEPSQLTVADGFINIPNPAFNRLYLPYHTATHFAGRGLSLHHFADWYCYLQQYGYNNAEDSSNQVFQHFTHALTYVCTHYLGLNNLSFEASDYEKELAKRLLLETLRKPYLQQTSSTLNNIYNKFCHFFYSRKNARASIGSEPLMKQMTERIICNIREGRIFHLS